MLSNPILSAIHSRPLMSNIPASVACVLFTVVGVSLAVLYGNFAPKVAPQPVPPPPPAPAQVETVVPTQGQDSRGRSLPFTVYVLAAQLSWRLESTNELEGGQTLLSPVLVAAINGAAEVFCVGTASFEGGARAEEARAGERAGRLAQWVGTAVANTTTRVFTLNAGQYRGPKELASTEQRKAVILITGPHDAAVDLGEALGSGLQRIRQTNPVVNSLLSDYSRSHVWLRHPGK
jgi:hypothetical protein